MDGASNWVGDLDLGSSLSCIKLEADFFRVGSTEENGVIFISEKSSGEATHAPLPSVEGVPNMVHHGVNGVVKAILLVDDVNWLDGTIPGVIVQVLEH